MPRKLATHKYLWDTSGTNARQFINFLPKKPEKLSSERKTH